MGDDTLAAALGRAIRVRRAELGLRRADVAERAGLSYPYVSDLENGAKGASSRSLVAVAGALDLRPHELLARAEDLDAGPIAEGRTSPASAPVVNETGASRPLESASVVPNSATASDGARRRSWFRAPGDRGTPHPRGGSVAEVVGRLEEVLRDVPPADAEAALLALLGEERLRAIVRDELRRAGAAGNVGDP